MQIGMFFIITDVLVSVPRAVLSQEIESLCLFLWAVLSEGNKKVVLLKKRLRSG